MDAQTELAAPHDRSAAATSEPFQALLRTKRRTLGPTLADVLGVFLGVMLLAGSRS